MKYYVVTVLKFGEVIEADTAEKAVQVARTRSSLRFQDEMEATILDVINTGKTDFEPACNQPDDWIDSDAARTYDVNVLGRGSRR
jgi:hypothetical protein